MWEHSLAANRWQLQPHAAARESALAKMALKHVCLHVRFFVRALFAFFKLLAFMSFCRAKALVECEWGTASTTVSEVPKQLPNWCSVVFNVRCAKTRPGEGVFVVGSDEALAAWDTARSIQLETTRQTYPLWQSKPTHFRAETMVEFKLFVRKEDGHGIVPHPSSFRIKSLNFTCVHWLSYIARLAIEKLKSKQLQVTIVFTIIALGGSGITRLDVSLKFQVLDLERRGVLHCRELARLAWAMEPKLDFEDLSAFWRLLGGSGGRLPLSHFCRALTAAPAAVSPAPGPRPAWREVGRSYAGGALPGAAVKPKEAQEALDAFIKKWKAPKATPPPAPATAAPPTTKPVPDHAVSAPKPKGSVGAGTLSSYSEEFEDDKYSEGTRYSDSERASTAK
eukprot:s1224_g7.t1